MHKKILILTFLFSLFVLSCEKYENLIKENTGSEYVYVRPNNMYGAVQCVCYKKDAGYTSICDEKMLLGESLYPLDTKRKKKKYKKLIKEGGLAKRGVKKNASVKVDFELTVDELKKLNLDAKLINQFKKINKVTLILSNGKMIEVLDKSKYGDAALVEKVLNSKCYDNILTHQTVKRSTKFMLTTHVYRYDLEYVLYYNNNMEVKVDIESEYPKVYDLIKSKLASEGTNVENLTIKGTKLFIGFNGIDLKKLLKKHQKLLMHSQKKVNEAKIINGVKKSVSTMTFVAEEPQNQKKILNKLDRLLKVL